MPGVLVQARNLQVYYALFKGFVQRLLGGGAVYVKAVDGISFDLQRGEILGLVGESGCGKSTVGRALLGLAPVTAGEVTLEFPDSGGKARFVRPRGIRVVCATSWALGAVYLLNLVVLLASGTGFLPLGRLEGVAGPYGMGLAALGALQAAIAVALWLMRPWSRRPARVVQGAAAAWTLLTLPFGLLLVAIHVAILVYLGSPDPTGLLRRSGRLVPATRFVLNRDGIVEGTPAVESPSTFERWFIGPRAVRTTGTSWVLRELRSKVQIIYQDPHAALNPALILGESLEHAIEAHAGGAAREGRGMARVEVAQEALRLLDDVGLRPPRQFYGVRARNISGGQKQRAVIARALAPRPLLIVADEPVALLDMSIRAMILELLLDLKAKYGLTYVFITHDLATAKLVCDRIAIMYLGRIVEMGESRVIFEKPLHPYTQALLQAIPVPDPSRRTAKVLPKGEVPSAVAPPAGCRFHPRCPVALPTCGWEGRDFLDFLEERRLDPDRARAEEAAFGPIRDWSAEGLTASRRVTDGEGPILVERIRAALVDAPPSLAQAVERIAVDGNRVGVRFQPPTDLGPKEVENRTVECLLY